MKAHVRIANNQMFKDLTVELKEGQFISIAEGFISILLADGTKIETTLFNLMWIIPADSKSILYDEGYIK